MNQLYSEGVGFADGADQMIRRAMSAAILFCVASSASVATVIFKDYKNPRDELTRNFNKLYFDGVKDGLIAFNVALVLDGKSPLFCLPPKMGMTVEQADDIMMRMAETAAPDPHTPISSVLLAGLRETFPCAAK